MPLANVVKTMQFFIGLKADDLMKLPKYFGLGVNRAYLVAFYLTVISLLGSNSLAAQEHPKNLLTSAYLEWYSLHYNLQAGLLKEVELLGRKINQKH